MSNQQLAESQPKRRDIRDLIQSDTVKNQVALALPQYLTPERMLRICVTSVNRNPKLLECTPESLLSAIMQAAQMGLEPDGRNGHLIPYSNKGTMECQFQADYKGLVALVRRNPDVQDVYADLVRDKDNFTITKGLHRDLVHEIDIRSERGEIIGAYAVIQYRGGTASFEFMSKHEIDEIRKRSKSSGFGPWVSDFGEMAKKTVIKRLLKLADLSPETHERLSVDTEIPINDRVTEIPRAQIAGPANEAQSLENGGTQTRTLQGGSETPTITSIESGKPTPRAGRKLPATEKKKPTPEPETPPAGEGEEQSVFATLVDKLKEAGYTPEQLFAVAVENKWTDPGWTRLEDMSQEKLEAFEEDWETALTLLAQMHGQAGEKSPFA